MCQNPQHVVMLTLDSKSKKKKIIKIILKKFKLHLKYHHYFDNIIFTVLCYRWK